MPTDIGMFEAVPWPENIWAILGFVMMFAAEGRSAVRRQLVCVARAHPCFKQFERARTSDAGKRRFIGKVGRKATASHLLRKRT